MNIITKRLISQKEDKDICYVINNTIYKDELSNVYIVNTFDKENIVLKDCYIDMESDIDRNLLYELNILQFAKHRNILHINDIGITKNSFIYTYDLTLGTWKSQVDIISKMNIQKRLELFTGLVTAVKYLHCNSIIHCNINYNNIHVINNIRTGKLQFSLTNFRHSTFLIKDGGIRDNYQNCNSSDNLLTINPKLSSPELIFNIIQNKNYTDNIDMELDIWQLGLLFYFIITGTKFVKGNKLSDKSEINVIDYFKVVSQLYTKNMLNTKLEIIFVSLLHNKEYQYDIISATNNRTSNSVNTIFHFMLECNAIARPEIKEIYKMLCYINKEIINKEEVSISILDIEYEKYCNNEVNLLEEGYYYNDKNSIKRSFISDDIGFPNSRRRYYGSYNKETRIACIDFLEVVFHDLNLSLEMLICTIDLLDRIASKILISIYEMKLYCCIASNLAMKFHCRNTIDVKDFYNKIKSKFTFEKFINTQYSVLMEMKFDIYRHPVYLLQSEMDTIMWYRRIREEMLNYIPNNS